MEKRTQNKLQFFRYINFSRQVAIISAILFIVLLFFFLLFKAPNIDKSGMKRILLSAFEKCSGETLMDFNYDCMRTSIVPLVNKKTLPILMEILEEIFSTSKITIEEFGAFTCHPTGHIVGETAVKKGLSFADVASVCDRACDYGCAHGAFVQELRKSKEFLTSIGSFCKQYETSSVKREMSSCAHVVGHGIGEIIADDPKRAISYCDQITDTAARHACGQGLIMEYFLGLPDRPKKIPLTAENILSLCGKLPGVYMRECFDNVGMYAAKVSHDENSARTICDDVPKESALKCIYSLGSSVYFLYRHNRDQMSLYCLGFDKERELACIKGAIETSMGEDDSFSYGRSLCDNLNDSRRLTCLSFLGDQVEWARGKEYRMKMCKADC